MVPVPQTVASQLPVGKKARRRIATKVAMRARRQDPALKSAELRKKRVRYWMKQKKMSPEEAEAEVSRREAAVAAKVAVTVVEPEDGGAALRNSTTGNKKGKGRGGKRKREGTGAN